MKILLKNVKFQLYHQNCVLWYKKWMDMCRKKNGLQHAFYKNEFVTDLTIFNVEKICLFIIFNKFFLIKKAVSYLLFLVYFVTLIMFRKIKGLLIFFALIFTMIPKSVLGAPFPGPGLYFSFKLSWFLKDLS